MIKIDKPKIEDIDDIRKILEQWTEDAETIKHLQSIVEEINGHVKFKLHFWVARGGDNLVGITGLSDPLPKVIHLAKSDKPAELKILYIDNTYRGKGVGKLLVEFTEREAIDQGYTELLIRTAERYKETAWGFYDKLGYERVGTISGGNKLNSMQVFSKLL